jgi:hypothetical protein
VRARCAQGTDEDMRSNNDLSSERLRRCLEKPTSDSLVNPHSPSHAVGSVAMARFVLWYLGERIAQLC